MYHVNICAIIIIKILPSLIFLNETVLIAGTGLKFGDNRSSGKLFVLFLVLRGMLLVLLAKLDLFGDVVPDELGLLLKLGVRGGDLKKISSDLIARIPEAWAGVTSSAARISLFFLRSVGVVGSSSIGGNIGALFTLVLLFRSCTRSMSIAGTCAGSLMLI